MEAANGGPAPLHRRFRATHLHCRFSCRPPFIAGFRSASPSLPVFRAHEAEVRPPYDQRAMAASAQYSVTVRVELDARQEPLGKLTAQIAEAGGSLVSVDLIPGAGPEGKRVRE